MVSEDQDPAGPHSQQEAQPEDVTLEPVIPGTRPAAPDELNADEKAEWHKFTLKMPENWFPPETWPLLAQLCRHICQGRWVGECLQEVRAGLARDLDAEALEKVERLVRMHDREGRAMVGLMLKLRLTSQQRLPDEDVVRRGREAAAEVPEVLPWLTPGVVKRERDKDRDWERGVRQ